MKISKNRLNICREFTFSEEIEQSKLFEEKLNDEFVRFFDKLIIYPMIAVVIVMLIFKLIF